MAEVAAPAAGLSATTPATLLIQGLRKAHTQPLKLSMALTPNRNVFDHI